MVKRPSHVIRRKPRVDAIRTTRRLPRLWRGIRPLGVLRVVLNMAVRSYSLVQFPLWDGHCELSHTCC